MDESKLLKLKEIFGVLNNLNRLKIVFLCGEKGLTVTEISKKLKLNYNITSEYVSALSKAGLVQRKRNPDRTVTVTSLIAIKENGTINIK